MYPNNNKKNTNMNVTNQRKRKWSDDQPIPNKSLCSSPNFKINEPSTSNMSPSGAATVRHTPTERSQMFKCDSSSAKSPSLLNTPPKLYKKKHSVGERLKLSKYKKNPVHNLKCTIENELLNSNNCTGQNVNSNRDFNSQQTSETSNVHHNRQERTLDRIATLSTGATSACSYASNNETKNFEIFRFNESEIDRGSLVTTSPYSYLSKNEDRDVAAENLVCFSSRPKLHLDEDEAMDWNNIEEEVLNNLQEIRHTAILNNKILPQPQTALQKTIAQNLTEMPTNKTLFKEVFVVVDTNIFISHLYIIQEVVDVKINGAINPVIMIPWMVIQELDYIKEDKCREKLKSKARSAIRYINEQLSNKDGPVKGQSIHDAIQQDVPSKNADDGILNCCLQIFKKGNKAVLLSNDTNLRNKAIIHGIMACRHDRIIKELDPYREVPNKDSESKIPCNKNSELCKQSDSENVTISKIKSTLSYSLSFVLFKVLEETFGPPWQNMCPIKKSPPWTVEECLQLFMKYWRSVFYDRLQVQFIKTVRDFSEHLKGLKRRHPTYVKKIVDFALAMCIFLRNGLCDVAIRNCLQNCSADIEKLI